MLSVEQLISLNHALVEEERLSNQLNADTSCIDDELQTKYWNMAESCVKISCLTKALRSKAVFKLVDCRLSQDSKYLIKKSQDLGINSISLAELAVHVMKKEPLFLMDYLDKCSEKEQHTFMNELPWFYFDYTEIKGYSDFLSLYFSRKLRTEGMKDIKNYDVGYFSIGLSSDVLWADLGE